MPPRPTHTHQRIVLELATTMRTFVQQRNLGIVQIGPLPVRLWPGKVREPDILFPADEHSDRIGEQAYGPPDFVVEVLSLSTRKTDRLEKMVEYAQADVREYWLSRRADRGGLHPTRKGLRTVRQIGQGEEARSEVLAGFRVKVGALLE